MLHLLMEVVVLTRKIIRKQAQTQIQVVMKRITHEAQEIGEMIGEVSSSEMSGHGKVKT